MGKKLELSGHFQDGKSKIDVTLSLIHFEEDGLNFIYSPALDLTGYGKTKEDALASYSTSLEEFLRYTSNKDTTVKELKRLGWSVSKKDKITAPSLTDLLNSREYLVEIFDQKEYSKFDEKVSLPVLA